MFQPFRTTLLEGVPACAGAVMWFKKENLFRECVSNCSVRFAAKVGFSAHIVLRTSLCPQSLSKNVFFCVHASKESIFHQKTQQSLMYKIAITYLNIASILENIFLYLFQTGGLDQFIRAIHWLVID